jgi:xylan 1,4-beta-xylosidase
VSRVPGWHVLGRETFLTPVTWDDGDDFDRLEPHPSRLSPRDRSAEHCTRKERPGSPTLRARDASLDEPDVVFVGRRHQYRACQARPLIDPAQGCGGLAVRLDEPHRYGIEADGTEVRMVSRVGSVRAVLATQPVPAGPIVLAARKTEPSASRDARTDPTSSPSASNCRTEPSPRSRLSTEAVCRPRWPAISSAV